MQINISGHHVEVTDSLKAYVEEKIEKLERHFDNITRADITLTVEKLRQTAEGNVHISGHDLHASAESEDMYASIDALTDKLDRQLLKHKEKMIARKQGHG
jgi:putative sigma-54 modulation protein